MWPLLCASSDASGGRAVVPSHRLAARRVKPQSCCRVHAIQSYLIGMASTGMYSNIAQRPTRGRATPNARGSKSLVIVAPNDASSPEAHNVERRVVCGGKGKRRESALDLVFLREKALLIRLMTRFCVGFLPLRLLNSRRTVRGRLALA